MCISFCLYSNWSELSPGDARKYGQFKVITCLALRHQVLLRKRGSAGLTTRALNYNHGTFQKVQMGKRCIWLRDQEKLHRGVDNQNRLGSMAIILLCQIELIIIFI